MERGAFGLVEAIAGVVDGEIELGAFGKVSRLVYDETADFNSGANR